MKILEWIIKIPIVLMDRICTFFGFERWFVIKAYKLARRGNRFVQKWQVKDGELNDAYQSYLRGERLTYAFYQYIEEA